MSDKTLLVSSIGTGGKSGYGTTTYVLDRHGTHETCFSPIALAEIVEVDHALIARTDRAAINDDALREGFETAHVTCEFEEIPKISSRDDIDLIMGRLIERIRERDPESVVLDITHAFRSLPMVFFASVIYLDALSEVELDGIYYGEFRGDEESPLVDMTHLHRLMEWYHAISTFERTGELQPVNGLLNKWKRGVYDENKPSNDPDDFEDLDAYEDLVRGLNGASQHFDSGLPLKAGGATRQAIDALDKIDDSQFIGPEGKFFPPLRETLAGFDSAEKADIELDHDELHRQRKFVKFYQKNNKYRFALGCARELFINYLLYVRGGYDQENWLRHGVRDRMKTRIILEVKERQERNSTTNEDETEEIDAIKLWDRIRQPRNKYAHSGFNEEEMKSNTKVNTALDTLCAKIDDDSFWEEVV